jgi:hypothetical protein
MNAGERYFLLALVAGLLGAACTDGVAPPASGVLQLSVTTTGDDPDSDGYLVRVDSGPAQPVPPDGSVTIPGVTAGSHSVGLSGLAANCAVGGADPRAVTIAAGDTAHVVFTVACNPLIGGAAEVAGVWDWTEHFDDPTAGGTCDDTGTYVFVVSGTGFSGTSDQVGTCVTPFGPLNNTLLGYPVVAGTVTAGGVQFTVGYNADCQYTGALSGSRDELAGSATCGTAAGRWTARRGLALSGLMLTPTSVALPSGAALPLAVELRNSLGDRVFGRRVTWSADAPAIAAVDSTGRVSAGAPGSAHIQASAAGISARAAITVGGTAVMDSVGDTFGDPSEPQFDILSVGAAADSSGLTVVVRLAEPLAAPFYGYVDLDTDQDPATGAEAVVDVWRPDSGGSSGLGDELVCDLSSGDVYDAVTGEWIATVPLFYDGATNAVLMLVPGYLLVGPRANLAVVVGNEYWATDIAPNEGHLTLGGSAATTGVSGSPPASGVRWAWGSRVRAPVWQRRRAGKIP